MGWNGEPKRHELASRGIRTSFSRKEYTNMRTYFNNPEQFVADQLKHLKFPIVVYPSNVDKYDDMIKHWAEIYDIPEVHVKKAFQKITISWSEFIDLYDIKDSAQSDKEFAKDEYREYRRDARENGWLEEVPPFKQWYEESYNREPSVKDYFIDTYQDETERMELANRIINDVESNLDYYADSEMMKIRDKLAQ